MKDRNGKAVKDGDILITEGGYKVRLEMTQMYRYLDMPKNQNAGKYVFRGDSKDMVKKK